MRRLVAPALLLPGLLLAQPRPARAPPAPPSEEELELLQLLELLEGVEEGDLELLLPPAAAGRDGGR